ncbi:MAG: hypothetical protein PVI21_00120 [Candidatus Woesebacteria bacterium]|jgi:hypothetical protein
MADKPKKVLPNNNAELFEPYFTVLQRAQTSDLPLLSAGVQDATAKVDIEDEIAREKKIKNDDAEQDIRLKRKTLGRLFGFLSCETFAIFIFAYMQATKLFGFALEEWSFKLLTVVTITQITVMLRIAVKYLFPQRSDNG